MLTHKQALKVKVNSIPYKFRPLGENKENDLMLNIKEQSNSLPTILNEQLLFLGNQNSQSIINHRFVPIQYQFLHSKQKKKKKRMRISKKVLERFSKSKYSEIKQKNAYGEQEEHRRTNTMEDKNSNNLLINEKR